MSKIPWYPPGCRPKKAQNSSNSIVGCTNVTETELALFTSVPTSTGRVKGESFIHSKQQPLQYGTKRKHEADQGKKVGKKQKPKPVLDPSRPMRPYTQHKYQPVFTPEELAQKRRIAIEEEAVKKALREKVAQQKIEERWIELGKAICSVTPHDFGIDDLPKVVNYDAFSLDETLANVVNFAKNLNSLVGNETKKTILANTLGFAGALCNVPQRSLVHIDKRVQNTRQLQDELDQKEKEAKARMDECWTEIGKAICSFTIGEFGVTLKDSSPVASNTFESDRPEKKKSKALGTGDVVASTSKRTNRFQKEKAAVLEGSDDDYVEEDDEDEDFEIRPAKRLRSVKNSKGGLANRGEDVVANVFNFSAALRDMMENHSKQSCLRSPFEFTSVICNLAEKSVRDRHTKKSDN